LLRFQLSITNKEVILMLWLPQFLSGLWGLMAVLPINFAPFMLMGTILMAASARVQGTTVILGMVCPSITSENKDENGGEKD
jgi:hypothetical protein